MRTVLTFGIIALLVGSAQAYLWFTDDYTDITLWQGAARDIAVEGLPKPDNDLYLYPATTLFLPLQALMQLHQSPEVAVPLLMTVLITLGVLVLAYLCRRIAPRSYWWIAAAGITGLAAPFTNATPPTALCMVLVPLLIAATLYAYQEREAIGPFLILGIIGGITCATRWDLGGIVLACCLLFLLPFSPKRAVVAGFVSLVTLFVCDPYLIHPLEHIRILTEKLHKLYGQSEFAFIRFGVVKSIPFAFLSIALGAVLTCTSYVAKSFRIYLVWLLATTILVFSILLSSQYHPDWYFYPLLFAWQMLLPYLLLMVTAHAKPFAKQLPNMTQKGWEIAFVVLLIAGQAVVYFHPALQVSNY